MSGSAVYARLVGVGVAEMATALIGQSIAPHAGTMLGIGCGLASALVGAALGAIVGPR